MVTVTGLTAPRRLQACRLPPVLGPSGAAPVLRFIDEAGGEHHHAGVLLVSNNPYALDRPLAPGTRPALDSGQLGIVVIGAPDDGPLRPRGRAWAARHLEVNAPALLHAGVDGEAVSLNPPLRFTARPAELRVRISARHPGGSPSARLAAALPSRWPPVDHPGTAG